MIKKPFRTKIPSHWDILEKATVDEIIFRIMVMKSGKLVGIHLRPHDLRRHSATYASRSGVPIEIVSKVILRHANLSTTQPYLGKISDTEAIRWVENLYG